MRFGFHTIHFSPTFGGCAPVLDVVGATGDAGFDTIGVDLASVDAHVAAGGTVAGMAAAVADAGLQCSDVLVLAAGGEGDVRATAARLGGLAEALGAPVCIAAVAAPVPWHDLVHSFADCADVLAGHGCRLAVEFTPYSPLATLREAVELCAAIGWDRAALVLDSLHFFRSGAPWDDLAALSAEQVALVQWDDAPAAAPASLIDESRNHRLLPGHGGLPLPSLASALRARGYEGVVAAEILSQRLRASDVGSATRSAYAALRNPDAGWVSAATG